MRLVPRTKGSKLVACLVVNPKPAPPGWRHASKKQCSSPAPTWAAAPSWPGAALHPRAVASGAAAAAIPAGQTWAAAGRAGHLQEQAPAPRLER